MRRAELGTSWLQLTFARMAEQHKGFTYAAYEQLCKDLNGAVSIRELLFQMRLLWTAWMRTGEVPNGGVALSGERSGLPDRAEDRLRDVFSSYLRTKGLDRFRENVLAHLRREGTGLVWFRRVMVGSRESALTVEEWEDFLKDGQGQPCVGERIFQMHLMLANLWRETRGIQ